MGKPLWVFMERVTPSGRGVVSDWYEKDIEAEAQDEFDDILRNLAVTPRDLWVRPAYDTMTPEFGEIRFFANKLQHRVFGFFLRETSQYVMLVGATKKGKNYTPRDALTRVPWYKTTVLTDRKLIRPYAKHII
ncbi:MAG TPA: hypothetical protein VHQ94_05615 [Pyrinomonadaceae bacterium]|jgi:hypothetical protein|nr:hypothetical protein [Pyrinomonadaceae bacterium]